jgi:hypothetical protein
MLDKGFAENNLDDDYFNEEEDTDLVFDMIRDERS